MALLQKLTLVGQEQFNRGNLRKAKTAFEYAYKKAKLSNSIEYQESTLLKLSATYMAAKKPDCAVTCLRVALDLELSYAKQGVIHSELANAYEMLNKFGEALNHYDEALAAYSHGEESSPEAVANTAIKAGMFFMKLGKYKKAIEKFNISTKTLSEKELVIQLAVVLCMKAQCLVRSNATVPEAIDVCEECLKLCKSVTPDFFVVNLYNELGLILTQSKQYERSYECYRLSLEVVDDLEDGIVPPVKRAALMQNMGAVLNSIGKYKEAANYSKRAADIYGSAGVRSSQCHCFINIAFGYSQLLTPSDIDKSEEYYLHALLAAKDTGSLRDQWQALEGLAGIALSKKQTAKAVEYYQKAVGICAAIGSNTYEQDRLVRKLSAALRSKISLPNERQQFGEFRPNSAVNPQGDNHGQFGDQPLLVLPLSSPLDLTLPPQNFRPANADASRNSNAMVISNMLQPQSSSTRRKKRKRTRRLSRRSDQDVHPVHGIHEPVHRGLGSYQLHEDHAEHYLAPHHIGRRRNNIDDASSIASGLHIKGLAVTLDDPTEPNVSSGALRDDLDEVDSAGVVRVRPMSGKVLHRRSTIIDSRYIMGSDSDSADKNSDWEDESADFQELDDSGTSGSLTNNGAHRSHATDSAEEARYHSGSNSSKEDVEPAQASASRSYRSHKRRDQYDQDDATDDAVVRRTFTAENQLYGSHVKDVNSELVTSVELRPDTPSSTSRAGTPKSRDKGKRLMTAKPSLKRTMKVTKDFSDYANHHSLTQTQRHALLDAGPVTDSEEDHQAVKYHMRQLSNLVKKFAVESTESETDTEKKEHTQGSNTTSSSEDDDLNNSYNGQTVPEVDTYERPLDDSVNGGNFFKSKGHRTVDPIYETIPTARTSAPVSHAPPPLPQRNYDTSKQEDHRHAHFDNSGDRDSPDVGAMTRGERDQYLRIKQETKNVKVVKWEEKSTEKKSGNPKSKMCLVM